MIYVHIIYKSKLTGLWMEDEKQFTEKHAALRGMYAMKAKDIIIDGWRCDEPEDNTWLFHRFK